jgi:argininosuccinate lyase
MRDELFCILNGIKDNIQMLIKVAEDHIHVVMPGYTHLQVAQPVLFAHYIMAYVQMLRRDYSRFEDALNRMNYSPLGSGAIAGTTLPINRHFVAESLGFTAPTENSIDSVSDRDHVLEVLSDVCICFIHMSRLSEELILFSAMGLIELDEKFTTGSSMMPQKKNPDVAELIRGKCGRVIGNMTGFFATMKALPLSYNKDMQEDKEPLFDTLDTLKAVLNIMPPMLASMKVNDAAMLRAAASGYSTATDMAEYLVKKDIPFRHAHDIVGRLVAYAISINKQLQELTIEEFQEFSQNITEDVYSYITVHASVQNRKSYGGTAPSTLNVQMKEAKIFLDSISGKD